MRIRSIKVFTLLCLYTHSGIGLAEQGDGLYEPGSVSRLPNLEPPVQVDDPSADFLAVEENLRLFKFEQGDPAGQVMLVIHGGPCGPYADAWPGLEEAAPDHRIIYYHQRGCGRSDGSFTPIPEADFGTNMFALHRSLGLTTQLADIERIRRIVAAEKITLVGHSFGAFLAALYAAEFPGRVNQAVFIAPANLVAFPMAEDIFTWVARALPEAHQESFAAFQHRYYDFGGLFTKTASDLADQSAEFATFYKLALQAHYDAYQMPDGGGYQPTWMPFATYFGLGQTHHYGQFLQRVQAKTLVIHGRHDLQPEAVSAGFSGYFSNRQFVVIDAASHFAFVENSNALNSHLRAFFQEL